MDVLVSLAVPFIVVSIFSVMVDRMTIILEGIIHAIPGLPYRFEWMFSYAIVLAMSFVMCFYGDFGLFIYLDVQFHEPLMDYILTALMISGGSVFVREQFENINSIPSVVMGATAVMSSQFKHQKESDVTSVHEKQITVDVHDEADEYEDWPDM